MGVLTAQMRLGIFGGTFDPIHTGHLLIAELTWQALDLQRVLFLPAGNPPHKQQQKKTAAHHRQAMVALAIAGNPHFELSTIDLERSGPNYSSETVASVRARYNIAAEACFFIIGGDSLQDLPTWHAPEALLDTCRLAVIQRPGYQPNLTTLTRRFPTLESRLDWVDTPQLDISASDIRQRVQAGLSVRYQVPDAVRDYMAEQQLYQP